MTDVIDDLSQPPPRASNGAAWELVADRVVGGVSNGTMRRGIFEGREAIHMQDDARFENNGGFLQVALDVAPDGAPLDASDRSGIEIDVIGNDESSNIHLRTADVVPLAILSSELRRETGMVDAQAPLRCVRGALARRSARRSTLRRIGIVAIGRAFHTDIAIGGIRLAPDQAALAVSGAAAATARPSLQGRFGRLRPETPFPVSACRRSNATST